MSSNPQARQLFEDGNSRLQAGDTRGAQSHFELALVMDPYFSEATCNLALLLEQAGATADAEALYVRAIRLQPAELQTWLNYGVLLLNARRMDEAEAVQRHALTLAPLAPPAWSALGVLLACRQRYDEAEQCYRKALELNPKFARARFNLGYILLRQGKMEEGWACYEAREHADRPARHFTCPRWRGENLRGLAIVISYEGGHGDMIQFFRYAIVLKAMGARHISVVCPPVLAPVMTTLAAVDEVLPYDKEVAVSGWDFWVLPMSLPLRCGTRLDHVPAPIPYLSADPARRARWAPRLPAAGLRVGLVWRGNPLFENDGARSLDSLAALVPLAAVAGISFVSLQKGRGEDEARLPPAGMDIAPLGADFADFADTAAVIDGLDLVISIDSAVAHLAGAMGKPCWVLLPDYRTDWRWMTERSDTPWYPTMRLFRQPPGGGWDSVIADVAQALAALVAPPGP